MKYEYTLTQFIEDYTETSSGYERVVVKNEFEVLDYDSLQTLISVLVDYGEKKIKFEIEKHEVEEVGLNE